MPTDATVHMSKNKFEKTVEEMTRTLINEQLSIELQRITHQVEDRVTPKLHRMVTDEIRLVIEQEFHNISIRLIESTSYKIIGDLINNGIVEFENSNTSGDILPPSPDKKLARKPLREVINKAKKLLIADPFFFHVPMDLSDDVYIEKLLETLPLSTLLEITVIYTKPKRNTALPLFQSKIPKEVKFIPIENDSIHDRVWVVDDKKAYIVGTSFNGIGKKLSFILSLPDEDLNDFNDYLETAVNKKTNNEL
jgi:hypothetical protein